MKVFKNILLLFVMLFYALPNIGSGQTYQYLSKAILSDRVQNKCLTDTITGTLFILDTAHIYITAIDTNKDTLWRTDPAMENKLEKYRIKRPTIVQFGFQKNKWTDNKEVIWIVYNNTQFGIIDKESGNFTWFGQD